MVLTSEKKEEIRRVPVKPAYSIVAPAVGPLIISIIMSAVLLGTDTTLRNFAPGHYSGLVAFTVISIIAVAAAFVRPKQGLLVAWVWSIVFLLILVGDLVLGASFGLAPTNPNVGHQAALNKYLLGLALFDGLIVFQIISIFLTAWGYSNVSKIPSVNLK